MKIKQHKGGFTLIEVLIAVLLVGMAVAALVAANGALTRANGAGTDMSTAEFLAGEIAELTALLPVVEPGTGDGAWDDWGPEPDETSLADYDDLNDFDGATGDGTTFSPPINAERTVLNDAAAFSQQVTVENVSPSNFEQVVANRSDFVRVTVRVFLNSRQISSASWLRARY